jgi:toxin FitB
MILDSNIIIYAARPQNDKLREFIRTNAPSVSAISYAEVLGYHRLVDHEIQALGRFFQATAILPVDMAVIEQAATLRRQRRMSLGDAIIAATAILHALTLVTHNVADFQWVPDLKVIDPIPS